MAAKKGKLTNVKKTAPATLILAGKPSTKLVTDAKKQGPKKKEGTTKPNYKRMK